MRNAFTGLVAFACIAAGAAIAGDAAPRYAGLPGGKFRTALRYEEKVANTVRIAPYALMRTPVTNGQFLAFVRANPEWQRDRVPSVFAEQRYLSHWAGPLALGGARPEQPVTWVTWFAAANSHSFHVGKRAPIERQYASAANQLTHVTGCSGFASPSASGPLQCERYRCSAKRNRSSPSPG